jgi:hypothetical protein
METYLPPVERPRGLLLKLVYFFSRRQLGKVATPISVFSARMPGGFMSFYGKISRLDKQLVLPARIAVVIREHISASNACMFCMDAARWYAMKNSPEDVPRIDALWEYKTSPLFSPAERAALDYATELTTTKDVQPETFERLASFYSEREICDIIWLVASEHVYNITNHGLNIGSDDFCELSGNKPAATAVSAA